MIPYISTNNVIKKEIQITQNKCLRTILHLPMRTPIALLHNTLKIDSINIRIPKLVENYLFKAKHNNEIIQEIINEHNTHQLNGVTRSKRSILDSFNPVTFIPNMTHIY